MLRKILCLSVLLSCQVASAQDSEYFRASYGELLPESTDQVSLWWASSGWKIGRDKPLPEAESWAVEIRAARNEAEAAQLVVRPTVDLNGFLAYSGSLRGPGGASISAQNVDVFEVRYVKVELPTDKSSVAGLWPDPLPPFADGIDLEANKNQPLWVRVKVPRDVPAGIYTGRINLKARNYGADVVLRVEVYDFDLPDKMTCTTAFGFSPGNVFKYHKLSDEAQKRQVLEKYWANLSAHHISPYNPAPLDALEVTWPEITDSIRPWEIEPEFDWTNWDAAMARAIDYHNFNSFRLSIPGMGGGTFHSRREPELLGFSEDTREYQAAFTAYCREMQEHLREKGWL
ncbi:MAG: hypothetical protein ACYSWQ_23365, partial [Planctomycetota bacterium]